MVRAVRDGNTLGVKISGENFQELKEFLKKNSFRFYGGSFEGLNKLWLKEVGPQTKKILEDLNSIEPISYN